MKQHARPRRANGVARCAGRIAALGLAGGLLLAGCTAREPEPAALDTRNDACASCRMAVSDARFAAQVVAPGELPRFFDDVGCLGDFLRAGRAPQGAVAYVADHRTKAWARAAGAVYTRVSGLETPMGSHVIAHADAASRGRDAEAAAGTAVGAAELFGPAGAPGAAR